MAQPVCQEDQYEVGDRCCYACDPGKKTTIFCQIFDKYIPVKKSKYRPNELNAFELVICIHPYDPNRKTGL